MGHGTAHTLVINEEEINRCAALRSGDCCRSSPKRRNCGAGPAGPGGAAREHPENPGECLRLRAALALRPVTVTGQLVARAGGGTQAPRSLGIRTGCPEFRSLVLRPAPRDLNHSLFPEREPKLCRAKSCSCRGMCLHTVPAALASVEHLQLLFSSLPTQELPPPQDSLRRMEMNNHVLRREILRQREVSELGGPSAAQQSQPPSALALGEGFVRLVGHVTCVSTGASGLSGRAAQQEPGSPSGFTLHQNL